jgi:hypothetical protein
MTEPLTPPDLDLRDFSYMPLEVLRLRDSEMVVLATAEEFRAAVLLWCASWHQVPASSLPSDDRLLANLAGYGRDVESWMKIRSAALRGFVECSDGRFYHPVIAEKAIEAAQKRRSQKQRTAAATEARRSSKSDRDDHDSPQRDDQLDDQRDDDVTIDSDTTETDRNVVQGNRIERNNKGLSLSDAGATRPDASDKFEEFWKAYPPRDGPNPRQPAEKKFRALVKTGVDPDLMIAAARKLALDEKARGNFGTRYIPKATRWLNEQRWADHAAVAFAAESQSGELSIEQAVQVFVKTGHWSRHAPVSDVSQAPAELLARFGLTPDGRRLEKPLG